MARFAWTPKRDQTVVDMWSKGATQADIGDKLGVTKNTIAGRVMRLRIEGRKLPRRQSGDPKLRQRLARKKQVLAVEAVEAFDIPANVPRPNYAVNSHRTGKATTPKVDVVPEVDGTICTTKFMDLKPKQCRYIQGFDANKLFCNDVAKDGSSFCEPHHKLCYTRAPGKFDRSVPRMAR
jgi:hypothetical protein